MLSFLRVLRDRMKEIALMVHIGFYTLLMPTLLRVLPCSIENGGASRTVLHCTRITCLDVHHSPQLGNLSPVQLTRRTWHISNADSYQRSGEMRSRFFSDLVKL